MSTLIVDLSAKPLPAIYQSTKTGALVLVTNIDSTDRLLTGTIISEGSSADGPSIGTFSTKWDAKITQRLTIPQVTLQLQ